jgi:hypothetical protein
MSLTSLIFTIAGSSIALLAAMTTVVAWAYRRGVAHGLERAKRKNLEEELEIVKAEISRLLRGPWWLRR